MTAVATRPKTAAAMKWWGWGDQGVSFTHDDKPAFAPFIQQELGVDVTRVTGRPVAVGDLDVPEPRIDGDLRGARERAVGRPQVSNDPLDPLVPARGQTPRDPVLHPRGELGTAPDVVVQPRD